MNEATLSIYLYTFSASHRTTNWLNNKYFTPPPGNYLLYSRMLKINLNLFTLYILFFLREFCMSINNNETLVQTIKTRRYTDGTSRVLPFPIPLYAIHDYTYNLLV